jgi:Lipocalin-like domain
VRTEAFGKNSAGLITYTADGLVMAIITNGATSTAYAGRYTLDGDKVIHHIEVASLQNIVNTDLVRLIKLKGNSLSLRTINMAIAGPEIAYREFVWERISNN